MKNQSTKYVFRSTRFSRRSTKLATLHAGTACAGANRYSNCADNGCFTFCRRTQDYPENLAVCNVIRINYMTSVHFSYGIVLYVQDI
jgi:hypothetical protein